MSKKLLIIVCAFLLAGCQLAKPEMDSVDTDRLIGYYLDFKPYEKMTLKESFNIDSQDYETSQSLDFSHLLLISLTLMGIYLLSLDLSLWITSTLQDEDILQMSSTGISMNSLIHLSTLPH